MSDINKLIPGMESFMEDTSVAVEVEVSEDAAVEETVEATDSTEEVSETVQENTEADAEAEMIFKHYEKVEEMQAYVEEHGVDRAFLRIHNKDNMLAEGLGIVLPSCESFDASGTPYSSESLACQEGFKKVMQSIWGFIKKIAEKIKSFVGRIIEAVRSRFMSLDKQIGRLNNIVKQIDKGERVDLSAKEMKEVKGKFLSPKALDGLAGKLEGLISNELKAVASKVAGNVEKFLQPTAKDMGLEKEFESVKKFVDEVLGKIKAYKAWKRTEASKSVAISTISLDQAKSALKTAGDMKRTIDLAEAAGGNFLDAAKRMNTIADRMKTRGENEGENAGYYKVARGFANLINNANSNFVSIMADAAWLAGQYARTAAARLIYGTKASSK